MKVTLTTFSGLINQSNELKQDPYVLFSVLCSEEQSARLKKITQQAKTEQFFSVGGEFYKGSRTMAVINFILDEPGPADFDVWVQNNCTRYVSAKTLNHVI